MDVGIVAQLGNERAHEVAEGIRETLGESTVVVDRATGEEIGGESREIAAMEDRDLLVSIGGDGTFLFTARECDTVPILGVNLGEVGFLNPVGPGAALETVDDVREAFEAGESIVSMRLPRIETDGDDPDFGPAVNDILVHGPRRGIEPPATFVVRVNDEPFVETAADGVLVATPIGSSAYNLSEGGPLVTPEVPAMICTLMAAEEPMPPLVCPRDATIECTIEGVDRGVAIADGRVDLPVEPPETLRITTAANPLEIAGPPVEFFEALEKLE